LSCLARAFARHPARNPGNAFYTNRPTAALSGHATHHWVAFHIIIIFSIIVSPIITSPVITSHASIAAPIAPTTHWTHHSRKASHTSHWTHHSRKASYTPHWTHHSSHSAHHHHHHWVHHPRKLSLNCLSLNIFLFFPFAWTDHFWA